MQNIAAFDPGLSGAFAIYEGDLNQAGSWLRFDARYDNGSWRVEDLPTMGAGKQTVLNGARIAHALRDVDFAVIEHVHAMPGQGVAGMFRFGTAFGQILGIVQALEIPYELVSPAKWKHAMNLAGGPGKGEVARLRALELFPQLHAELARKKDHNRAEALLLARWWLNNNQQGGSDHDSDHDKVDTRRTRARTRAG